MKWCRRYLLPLILVLMLTSAFAFLWRTTDGGARYRESSRGDRRGRGSGQRPLWVHAHRYAAVMSVVSSISTQSRSDGACQFLCR